MRLMRYINLIGTNLARQAMRFMLALIGLWTFTAQGVLAEETKPLEILAVHYPPYEFETPENGLPGFDVEVVESVFERIGRPAKVVFRPWARAKKMVFEGGGFALLSCGQREDRDAFLYYSEPISHLTWGYFYHKSHKGPFPEYPEALRGHSITVVRDYNQHKELDELGIKNLPVNSDLIAVTMVAKQRVEFAYIPREAAAYEAAKAGLGDEVEYKIFKTRSLHLCFSRKWPGIEEIVQAFNAEFEELKADGTYAAIHAKYGNKPFGS